MRNQVSIYALYLLLAGCASSPDDSEFADTPYIEKIGPGVIRYLNEGASFTKKARREDVHEKIEKACNGQYNIRKEGVMSSTGTITALNNDGVYSNAQYIYVHYECFP